MKTESTEVRKYARRPTIAEAIRFDGTFESYEAADKFVGSLRDRLGEPMRVAFMRDHLLVMPSKYGDVDRRPHLVVASGDWLVFTDEPGEECLIEDVSANLFCRLYAVPDAEYVTDAEQEDKPLLTGLFRDNPQTKEGKYLVMRRDGTVPAWPSFVLGARDPMAEVALRAYADAAEKAGKSPDWIASIRRLADTFVGYRLAHGDGDPDRGKHRADDPETVAKMRLGCNA